MNELLSTLKRSALTVLTIQVAGTGVGYLGHVFLARAMTGEDYGRFVTVFSWMLIIGSASTLGLPSALLRMLPEEAARKNPRQMAYLHRYATTMITSTSMVAAALIGGGIAGIIQIYLRLPENQSISSPIENPVQTIGLPDLLVTSPWFFVFAVAIIPSSAFLSLYQVEARVFSRMILAYLPLNFLKNFGIFAIAFIATRMAHSLLDVEIMGAVCGLFALLCLGQRLSIGCVPDFRTLHTMKFDLETITPAETKAFLDLKKKLLSIAIPLLFISVTETVLYQTDVLMISLLLTPEAGGIYFAASKTALLITFFPFAIAGALVPKMAALFASDRISELQQLIFRATRWAVIPAAVITGIIFLLSGLVLGLFGESFVAAQTSLQILAIGYLFSTFFSFAPHLLNVTGYQKAMAKVIVGCIILNTILNILLIPAIGIEGAAISTTISNGLWFCSAFYLAFRRLGIQPRLG